MLNRKFFVAAFLMLIPAAQIWADELTPAKKADLRIFLDISSAKNLPMMMANGQVQGMVPGVRKLDPKFPEKGFQIIRDQMAAVLTENAGKPDGLYDQMMLVYHNALSHDEIKEIVKFNQSPAGKKLSELQGKLGQENMQAAAKWAGTLAPEMDKRVTEALAKENIKLPKQPAPAAQKAPAPAKPAAPAPAPAAPK